MLDGMGEIEPLGDCAMTVPFADAACAVAGGRRLSAQTIEGVTDVVVAFDRVTVYFDPSAPFDGRRADRAVREWILASGAMGGGGEWADAVCTAESEVIDIPVRYGGEDGPDLQALADAHAIRATDVIELHSAARYRVLAVGFLPGFAYLGGLPEALHTPRRPTPRPRVPAGTVGIGASYTGVYPVPSPGGWNLIGRTNIRLFDAHAHPPARLVVGRSVRFVPVRA